MAAISRVQVPFGGTRSGTARATFGQRGVWGELKAIEPDTQILNITSQVQVPALDDLTCWPPSAIC